MTITKNRIIKNVYFDSVVLMQLTVELEQRPGITKAAIMMGTPAILNMLEKSGLLVEKSQPISANDIVVGVNGDSEAEADQAITYIIERIKTGGADTEKSGSNKLTGNKEENITKIRSWRESSEDQQIALISVPGEYAAAEALLALKAGKNVFLFSNNVSVDDEKQLKTEAVKRKLLMMGPDCGTAVINGVPLGFANDVSKGGIGIVAASGSGLQELICLIDRRGGGISHAIGTGGRDLKNHIGGMMTSQGLDFLKEDENTNTIVVLSKPPDEEIAEKIIQEAARTNKKAVLCLLGASTNRKNTDQIFFYSTIEGAAQAAVNLEKGSSTKDRIDVDNTQQREKNNSRFIRGFYSGGTLAYETQFILEKYFADVYSNISADPAKQVSINNLHDKKHLIFDLGTEEFTIGRPHPMIDGRWRTELLSKSLQDRYTGIILFDVILGLGADKDPLGLLLPIIAEAKNMPKVKKNAIEFIAALVGTDKDPQNYSRQKDMLLDQGVLVAESNADAARIAAEHIIE